MRTFLLTVFSGVLVLLTNHAARAHQEPTSFWDLHIKSDSLNASVVTSITDLAHELAEVEPRMLLDLPTLQQHEKKLTEILLSRLRLKADGTTLVANLISSTPIPEREDIRFDFKYNVPPEIQMLAVECKLFPYDFRHRTYLNTYQGKTLLRQDVFEGETTTAAFPVAGEQGLWEVIREFTYEGVRHIFIGPDHILFVIGLLLLGGSVGRLLRIITAFTFAHSITLCLATFHIITPPASIVEPVIALSIVVVGLHAFFGHELRDPRLWFAFIFGLIHGFGFASVLQEMELPRHALGVSLFSFNLGVEIGQACIILAVAPVLALLKKRKPIAARQITQFAALSITTAGALWFFERVM
jgi:hydrogenase/urease accessory protein HupE